MFAFGFVFSIILFLDCFDCSSKILWSCFPIITSLIEPFTFGFAKLSFFFLFLLDNICLYHLKITCSLDVILLASELNYFLLDMNTILHAFACFSKAFRLNFRPQPSGQITKSFYVSVWSLDSSTSSSLIMGFSSKPFLNSYFIKGTASYFFFSTLIISGSCFFYYLFDSSFGCYFWIIILFWGALGGGSGTLFFSAIWGESFNTSLSPVGF